MYRLKDRKIVHKPRSSPIESLIHHPWRIPLKNRQLAISEKQEREENQFSRLIIRHVMTREYRSKDDVLRELFDLLIAKISVCFGGIDLHYFPLDTECRKARGRCLRLCKFQESLAHKMATAAF